MRQLQLPLPLRNLLLQLPRLLRGLLPLLLGAVEPGIRLLQRALQLPDLLLQLLQRRRQLLRPLLLLLELLAQGSLPCALLLRSRLQLLPQLAVGASEARVGVGEPLQLLGLGLQLGLQLGHLGSLLAAAALQRLLGLQRLVQLLLQRGCLLPGVPEPLLQPAAARLRLLLGCRQLLQLLGVPASGGLQLPAVLLLLAALLPLQVCYPLLELLRLQLQRRQLLRLAGSQALLL
jgi:hypothetical protein